MIVSARDSRTAAASVKRAGGMVTSDLWAANAVGAIVTAHRLETLATDPSVLTIVENKTVRPAEWNGWVSDIRVTKGRFYTQNSTFADPTHLPGGGFAVVTYDGELLVVNADGTERLRKRMPFVQDSTWYLSPVVLSKDGTIFYVADVYGILYAVGADGATVWTNRDFHNTHNYYARGMVASDGSLIMVTYNGTVFAFDGSTGSVRWQTSIVAKRAEYKTSPIIGPDDTLYVSSDQGDIFAVTASGVRWSTALNGGQGGSYAGASPVLNGSTLYAVSGAKLVAFDANSGAIRWSFTANSTLLGSAIVAPDGDVLVASETTLYDIAPNGQMRYAVASPAGAFARVPILSLDGTLVFAQGKPAKGKQTPYLMALRRANGTVQFNVPAPAAFTTQLVADPDGGVLLTTDNTSVYRFGADGIETHRLKTHAPITYLSHASETGNILVRLNSTPPELQFLGRLPNAWNGRKDVEPSQSGKQNYWRLMSNHSVDVGADQLHNRMLPSGQFLRGGDIGVAVVDSGVYWDASTRAVLGVHLQRQFIGQADFIDVTCPSTLGCQQRADHSFYDYNNSRDTYGHGTHVAGTVSNKLVDEAVSDQTQNLERFMGVAPDARILSVRVLGGDGSGSYETVIKGIQYVIANKTAHNIRVLNLSLSAYATVPYFVDPLCRAAERAWGAGIVVLAAAGNTGPFAETITSPGNDPYVITVGAVSANRTSAYWRDDIVPQWSASGPTFDGFPKPDLVAPGSQIVSYMYNDPTGASSPLLVKQHPDYSGSQQLFRMNGTSMATAVASGVVALMIQANPALTPDEVKYRLIDSARWAVDNSAQQPVFNTMQQGLGRVWAPEAVLGTFDPAGRANVNMNLAADLAAGYETLEDLAYHYQGPVRRVASDDGTAWLYYVTDGSGTTYALGATDLNKRWITAEAAARMIWGGSNPIWAGGLSWTGDANAFSSARMIWGGTKGWGSARMIWGGARMIWGGTVNWADGNAWNGGSAWGSARMIWGGSVDAWGSARMIWGGAISNRAAFSSNSTWISDQWSPPSQSSVPPPAATAP